MNVHRRLLCLAALLSAGARAQPLRELHGALDAWAEPGLALAWAIVRGRSEDDTQVLLRIEADPQRHARIAAQGRDPFGDGRIELLPPTPNPGVLTLRLPRKQFSEHPRTELRFFAPGADAAGVMVYYLGVPDTTPEFATASEAAESLKARLNRARDGMR